MSAAGDRAYHIARVITWLPPGGIEKRMAALLPRLNAPPFRVTVVCIHERGALALALEAAGVPVELIPMRTRLDPRGVRALARWFRDERVDLVHSHMYRSNVPATMAAHFGGVRPVLCQVHNVGTWESARQRWLDRWLMRWRTAMIAVSEEVKRDIVANLRCPPDRVRVLYNGIDLAEYGSRRPDPQLRAALGIPDGWRVVVMLARLVEQKKHTRLLQALEKIRRDIPPTRVLLVGDGGLRAPLEEEVRRRGLDGMVSFTGHRPDIPDLLALADLSVLTSDREGFSNAIVESLAAGVPVIATDVGGNAEAVENGKSGFIVRPDDSPALANVLQRLLSDDSLRGQMSQAARLRAERFSLDRMVQETKQVYLEYLAAGE
jgi:glycosyltransferase involved in cell wall biosynthesis